MASVSSVSSSSSIYGNRNVLSGLASGLDTESMIENAISAYKNKIIALQQKRTKTEWKQTAYQSMINKMSVFADKYTSYRSTNNLMSSSFFNQAVKTVAKGANADKITATGKASSDIQINRVKQLATAASYKLSGSALDSGTSAFGSELIKAAASGTLNLDEEKTISTFSGNMTLAYGGSNALSYLTVNFDETKTYDSPEALVEEINNQLKEQSVTIGSRTYTGQELLDSIVKAEVDSNGVISFADPKKNNVYISSASSSVKEKLLGLSGSANLSSTYADQVKTLRASNVKDMQKSMSTFDYLSEKGASMEITLDGVTKTVKLPGKSDIGSDFESAGARDKAFLDAFKANIDKAFGKNSDGKSKLEVKDANTGDGIRFQFETKQNGSTFSVSSSVGETLGFGESNRVTSYLNTGKTLEDLLVNKDGIKTTMKGDKKVVDWDQFEKAQVAKKDSDGNEVKDANGNTVMEDVKDANGKQLYVFRVNGQEVGQFNEDSTLGDVMNAMNNNSKSGVKVGYSSLTNELTFTAKETGASSEIDFSNPVDQKIEGDSLAAALFGVPKSYDSTTYTKGKDAIFEATVNGTPLGEITRSSNSVEMDGMTINLKGTFGYDYTQKYEFSVNKEGNTSTKTYTASGTDDRLKIMNGNTPLKYNAGSSTSMADFNGKEIYGKVMDGKMRFYVDDGKGNTQELYARQEDNGGVWFSINKDDKVSVGVSKLESEATETSTEAVSFETSSDADKIVDVVKQMVEDYNAMVTEIKNAYSTLPAQRSNGAYYEPLTDEDEEGMSESAIKNWEDKAKQGILFGDRDLANLYQRLTSAVSMTGELGATLRSAGITVNYSNGLSTLDFNEDDFRTALANDPDKVRDAFVSSTDSGASQNGLMQALKIPLDMYGKTSGGKGILVEKAGSPLASSTMYTNTIQKELNSIDEQIEKWQDKMSDQVDYYTNQFSRLEQLIQQMNAQSSYFAQLVGG